MTTYTLAIYGNHLSELDKAKTLENLGAKLLRTTHSSASYRLFASQDNQAFLCEDSEDTSEGRKIRVELWEITADAILQILQDLGDAYYLKAFYLSDGTASLAFLSSLSFCLTENHQEVSRFGGWERYLLKVAEQDA